MQSEDSAQAGRRFELELNRVALLLRDGPQGDFERAFRALVAERKLHVCAEATAKVKEKDWHLFIIRVDDPDVEDTIAHEMRELCGKFDNLLDENSAERAMEMWPLHAGEASRNEFLEVENYSRSEGKTKMRRLFCWLHISAVPGGRPFVRMIRDVYGSNVAYNSAVASFFIQKLWVISALAVLFGVVLVKPFDALNSEFLSAPRLLWILGKVLLLLWGAWVLYESWNQERVLEKQPGRSIGYRTMKYRGYRHSLDSTRLLRIALIVWPLRIVFMLFCLAILIAQVQFNAWLIFVWGGCLKTGCVKPNRGLLGTILLNASNTSLAVIFGVLKGLSGQVAQIVARIKNPKLFMEFERYQAKDSIYAAGVAKIGAFIFLGLAFVPQWTQDRGGDPDFDCSGYLWYSWLGDNSIFCLRERASLVQRQALFNEAMTGPFVITPFMELATLVLVPFLLMHFNAELLAKRGRARHTELVDHSVEIVARDADDPDSAEMLLGEALCQYHRKKYCAADEVLEHKLCFLSVVFFLPVKPFIIVPWIVSRILDSHTDIYKLLVLLQRPMPNSAKTLHEMHERFLMYSLIFATIWLVLLSLLTYNPDFNR